MSSGLSRREQTVQRLRAARPAVLPSLLLCDFGNLEKEVLRLEEAGVQAFHLDVMDGNFVPNLTYGMPIVAAMRKLTSLPLDVHLMISHPEKYAQQFIEAGADAITFHVEASSEPVALLEQIQAEGVLAGLAINPSTPWPTSTAVFSQCDLVLIMSVEAGFGGQAFDSTALQRLKSLRAEFGDGLLLEIDGGVNSDTIRSCSEAGADLLVVGSAIFRHADYCQAISRLESAMHAQS